MIPVVVPFRAGGKSRLPDELRDDVALAMLGDVLEAATAFGEARLVTDDPAAARVAQELGAELVEDPGGGQGAAVAAALAVLAGPCLVVNADLPCATPDALRRFARLEQALVAARDGTTNALSLLDRSRFEDLYGPGSAARFSARGFAPVAIAELECDVDTLDDLSALTLPLGRRTRLVTDRHKAGSVTAT